MVVKFAKLVPPLENGDRLDRDEFERRYNSMPSHIKAELINGVVFMASPVRVSYHAEPHCDLIAWLAQYRAFTPGVRSPVDATIRFDDKNVPQPDMILMIDPAKGGHATIDELDYLSSAPELVAEISASTVGRDLNDKLEVYRRFGVREYIVWRVLDEAIDWFVLRDGNYEPLAAGTDGIHKSQTFPGLWLDSTALLRSDLPAVFAVVQRGLAMPEHAEFVQKLSQFS